MRMTNFVHFEMPKSFPSFQGFCLQKLKKLMIRKKAIDPKILTYLNFFEFKKFSIV